MSEQIETVKLHVRSLVERLKDVTAATRQESAQLGALMLWSDKLATRCEEIGRTK